jgi:hypothetical protein
MEGEDVWRNFGVVRHGLVQVMTQFRQVLRIANNDGWSVTLFQEMISWIHHAEGAEFTGLTAQICSDSMKGADCLGELGRAKTYLSGVSAY